MRDLWLLAFDWPAAAAADPLAGLRGDPALATAGSGLQVWRALEGHEAYVYLDAGVPAAALLALAPAGSRLRRLVGTTELAGASAGAEATFHYVVETDVVPEHADDFDAWYEQEHLPGLAGVPGTVRAARYVCDDALPRHHACYDLASLETFGSPPWLAVRGSDWSARVRPSFRNTKRTMFRRG